MKKLLFILIPSVIVLALGSCKGGLGSEEGVAGGEAAFDPNDSIPRATALAMYAHYMDSVVDKSDSAIIRQIFPSLASMKQVFKTKDLAGIKFMVAAYLDTDPIVARRNQPMVMLQLKIQKLGPPTYVYYDLNSVSKLLAPQPPYCPPPPACTIDPEG